MPAPEPASPVPRTAVWLGARTAAYLGGVAHPSPRAIVPSLYDLASRLQAFAAGELSREALEAWMAPILDADALDVDESPGAPWEDAPEEERLYWRLLYLIETSELPDDELRVFAQRVLDCLASTGSPGDTLELLPLLRQQPRLVMVLEKRVAGVISRVGLLGFVAKSGYPAHVKLWLEYAGAAALLRLADRLRTGRYREVARMLERRPE